MTALIIILSILVFLSFLLLLPVKLQLIIQDHLELKLKIAFFSFLILGKKDKKAPSLSHFSFKRRMIDLRRSQLKKKQKKKKKESPPITLDLIKSIFKAITELLSVLSRKLRKILRIELNEMTIVYGSEDAAKTALVTGEIISLAQVVLDLFQTYTHFSSNGNQSIDIHPNYLTSGFTAHLFLTFSVQIGGLFALLYSLLIIFIKYKKLIFTFIK